MGLDIVATSRIMLIEPGSDVDRYDALWYEHGDKVQMLYGADYPERTDGLVDGIYRVDGEVFKFHAGSYSGYGWWRNELSKFAWGRYAYDERYGFDDERRYTVTDADKERPFYYLINFSDAEGAIGPKTSARLAAEFQEFRGKAERIGDVAPYGFTAQYRNWQRAFELASDNGAVIFR